MNFLSICSIFLLFIVGSGINLAYAQIDPSSDIEFFQTGEIQTVENQFLISDEFKIREFFNGGIVRISGQTIEGFPYITYSQTKNDKTNTFGKIFINGEFIKLSFTQQPILIQNSNEKKDDLSIITQYTQRAHSKQNIFIDVKIFDKGQNKHNDFSQNYAYVSNTNIQVVITNEDNQNVFSSDGITNDRGLFETKYIIPDNSKRETLTISINAENSNSKTSKTLQVFALGNLPTGGQSVPPITKD